ncbi:MAG: SCO family protein [Candidatus Methylomirabilales bacterium]
MEKGKQLKMKAPAARVSWTILAVAAVTLATATGLALLGNQASQSRVGSLEERPLEGLQVFGTVPPFSLVERSGRRVTRADLIGKVWIVNFFYTHCPDTCPLQTAHMAQLQQAFATAPDLRLVSITIDPERDTLATLRAYAERYGAGPDRWLFLTGEKEVIYQLAREGFHLGAGVPEERAQDPGIRRRSGLGWSLAPVPAWAHAEDFGQQTLPHSSRFVLVDRRARIRGYYPGTDGAALARLRRDALSLVRGRTDARWGAGSGGSEPHRWGKPVRMIRGVEI